MNNLSLLTYLKQRKRSFIINKTKYQFFPWVGNITLHYEILVLNKKPCFISSCEIPDLVTLRITACLTLHLRSFRIIQRAESSGLQSKPLERKGEKIKSSGSLGYIPFSVLLRFDSFGMLSGLGSSALYEWFLDVSYDAFKNSFNHFFFSTTWLGVQVDQPRYHFKRSAHTM